MNEAILHALEQAEQAINDTIALYCPEFSRESTVRAAQERMAEGGTLYYYATVLDSIRAAKVKLLEYVPEGRAVGLLALMVSAWDKEQSKRTQSIADEPWHIGQARKLLNSRAISRDEESK